MWSFVGSKANKQWLWLAIDADTREIIGVFVGDRLRSIGKEALGIFACGLPPVRHVLHGFLGSLQASVAQ